MKFLFNLNALTNFAVQKDLVTLSSTTEVNKRHLLKIEKINLNKYIIYLSNADGFYSLIRKFDNIHLSSNKLLFLTSSSFLSFRSILKTFINSLSGGYYFEFIIRGIGYRYKFHKKKNSLSLSFRLGYSHRILLPFLNSIKLLANKRFDFFIFSSFKHNLKNYGEQIRQIRQTDSYKGKGIKYYEQPLKLKVGKVR